MGKELSPEETDSALASILREKLDETNPQRLFIFPEMLSHFELSILDGAVLALVTRHTLQYGFCGLTYDEMGSFFNTSGQSIVASLKTLCAVEYPFQLICAVAPTKEMRLAYLRKNYKISSKKKEEGMLRAKCFRITRGWLAYIKPWLGEGEAKQA